MRCRARRIALDQNLSPVWPIGNPPSVVGRGEHARPRICVVFRQVIRTRASAKQYRNSQSRQIPHDNPARKETSCSVAVAARQESKEGNFPQAFPQVFALVLVRSVADTQSKAKRFFDRYDARQLIRRSAWTDRRSRRLVVRERRLFTLSTASSCCLLCRTRPRHRTAIGAAVRSLPLEFSGEPAWHKRLIGRAPSCRGGFPTLPWSTRAPRPILRPPGVRYRKTVRAC